MLRLKKILKYSAYTLLAITGTLVLGVWLLLNSDSVQNWITGRVTAYLSAQFKTKISIGHIHYDPIATLSLDEVYFADQKNDTLFYVAHMKVNVGDFDSDSSLLVFNDVALDGGLCKMSTYRDSTFSMSILSNFSSGSTDTSAAPFKILFKNLTCTNTRFRLIDSLSEDLGAPGFNGLNQDFYNITLQAKNFWIVGDSLSFDLRKISCRERCGMDVQNLSGNAVISPSRIDFNNLDIRTPKSHITHDYHMQYHNWDMDDYNNDVQMQAEISNSVISMEDVALFAPAIKDWKQVAYIANASFSGTIADFRARRVKLSTGDHSSFEGEIKMSGLPNIDETFMDIRAKRAVTTRKDLEYIANTGVPELLDNLGLIRFDGAYTGFYKDFVAYGNLHTSLGAARADMNMKLNEVMDKSSYSGSMAFTNFDIGRLFGQSPTIGKASAQLMIKGKGFSLKELQGQLSLAVSRIEIRSYAYQGITFDGSFNQKKLNCVVASADENAKLNLKGSADFSGDMPYYNFKGRIDALNFTPLHLDTGHISLATDADIAFAFSDINRNRGSITLNNIDLSKNDEDIDIEYLKLETDIRGEEKLLHLSTDFADVNLNGKMRFDQLGPYFYAAVSTLAPGYFKRSNKLLAAEDFSFRISISRSTMIRELALPDWDFSNLYAEGRVGPRIEFSIAADQLQYKNFAINGLLSKSNIVQQDKGTLVFGFDKLEENDTMITGNFAMLASLSSGKGDMKIRVDDSTGVLASDVNAHLELLGDSINLYFDKSDFVFRGVSFNIEPQSLVSYNGKVVQVPKLLLYNERENFSVSGFYDFSGSHQVRLDIERLDMQLINHFYRKMNVAFGGTVSGFIELSGNKQSENLEASVNISRLQLDNDTVGDISLSSNYNEKQRRILLQAKSINGSIKGLQASGYIDVSTTPYPLNINVAFAESDLKTFQPFLKEQAFISSGKVNASCLISGTVDNPEINGFLNLSNVTARVEYLKTFYTFSTLVQLTRTSIIISPFQLADVNGHKAMVSGVVTHKSFSDFNYNLRLQKLDRFQVLNTTSKDNKLYYGKAFVSGNISITGPQSELYMEADIRTTRGTEFNIPLDESDGSSDELITYINRDTVHLAMQQVKPIKLYGFTMSATLDITPDAEIQIIFDEAKGDKIRGKGSGLLRMELNRQGNFDMFGEVKIEDGDYKFTALDVFVRKFNLKKGSSITWAGDPLQARLNITGSYNVRRTSVANILTTVSETELAAAKQQRVPVECLMYIRGSLQSPEYKFDLNFSDIAGTLSSTNASALQNSVNSLRADPQQMEQQVINLVLFGSFLPVNGGQQFEAGGNLSSTLNNTLSDIASAQANNLISQVIPGFDFNVDIQTQTEVQKAQFILTASKRLLNDRLELQGSIDANGANNTNNFMTQYNLSRDGNLKARAYTRNATNPIYNRNINTQGVGLYYRKEFDKLIELFKKQNQEKINLNQ